MENRLNEIYDSIYNDQTTKNSKILIRKIEPDIAIIEEIPLADYDKYFKSTRLISDYAIGLVNEGYLKKALPYLDQAILRFENDQKLKEKNLLEEPMFEALIWNRGMINFNLQRKKVAKIDFLRLNENFPDNDKYKNWYKACSDYKYGIIEWIFAGIAIISIFFSFLLDPSDGIFDKIALYGIFVGLFGGLTFSYIGKKRLKM